MRGAIIHVIGDFVQSIGVAIAGALIWWHQVGRAGVGKPVVVGGWLTCLWERGGGCSTAGQQHGLQARTLTSPILHRPHISLFSPPTHAGRSSLVHRRPHLHLPVCNPGAVDHARHPARHLRRADGARAPRLLHQDAARRPVAGGACRGSARRWQRGEGLHAPQAAALPCRAPCTVPTPTLRMSCFTGA
jgi:hypothetical protein